MKKNKNKAQKAKKPHTLLISVKQNKELTALYFILRLVIIFIFVLNIIRGKYESAMTCGLTFILMLIPSFIDRSLHIELPSVLETFMILFVFRQIFSVKSVHSMKKYLFSTQFFIR